MSALRKEMSRYIDNLPEHKLKLLKPMIEFMYDEDEVVYERITEENITEEEKVLFEQVKHDYENGELIAHEDIDWD